MSRCDVTLWKTSDFTKLWVGESVSLYGSQVTIVALPFTAALTLHATPSEMGLLMAAQTVPALLSGPILGVLVDRWPKRQVLIWANVLRGFALASVPLASALGVLRLDLLYLVALVTGVLGLLFSIARIAFVPQVVAAEATVSANARLSASRAIARVIGPSSAGMLVQLVSGPGAILVDSLSFAVSVLTLLVIKHKETRELIPNDLSRFGADLASGLTVIFRHPVLRTVTVSAAFANGFDGAMSAVLILFMTRELGLEPAQQGLIFAALGPGSLVGSLTASRLVTRVGLGSTIVLSGMLLLAAAILLPFPGVVGFPPALVLGAAVFVLGSGTSLQGIALDSLRREIVPNHLLGRVTASGLFVSWGSIPIGALLGGLVGETFGLRAVVLAAVFGYALQVSWLLCSPVRSYKGRALVSR